MPGGVWGSLQTQQEESRLWKCIDLGSNLSLAAYKLCGYGQVTSPLWSSAPPSWTRQMMRPSWPMCCGDLGKCKCYPMAHS